MNGRGVIFEDGPRIELYCGDALSVLDRLVATDAVITDPPYGIAINIRHGDNWRSPERPQCIVGDELPFDPSPWLSFDRCLFWGANHFASRLPDGARWLVWDKRDFSNSNAQSDSELAWARGTGGVAVRNFHLMWNGAVRHAETDARRVHPTQKPISLMEWCIRFYPSAKRIVDPFMGSGTTGIACARLGRPFIGVELDPKYFDIAVRRISEAREHIANALPFESPAIVQEALF